jgi:hypothetical protein
MRHEAGLAILALLMGLTLFALWGRRRDRQRRRRAARIGVKINLIRSSRD